MPIVRRLAHVLIIVLTLAVGASAAAIVVSQTVWFKNWLRGYIVREANQYLNGELSIGRLAGNLFFGVELEDVAVSLDGEKVVAVKNLGLDYNVFHLISRGLSIDDITLTRPVVYLRKDGDVWSIARVIKRSEEEATREGPASPISIDTIGIRDASVIFEEPVGTAGVAVPQRFEDLNATFSFKYEPVHYSIQITSLSFKGVQPSLALDALSGTVAIKDDALNVSKLSVRTENTSVTVDGAIRNYLSTPILNLVITSDGVSLPEMAHLVPSLEGIDLRPTLSLRVEGPMDRLGVEMNVELGGSGPASPGTHSAGHVAARLVADMMMPGQSVKGDITVRRLDLAPLLKDPRQTTDLTGAVQIDLAGDSFTDVDSLTGNATVDAPTIVASGYRADRVRATARLAGGHVSLSGRAAAYGAGLTAEGRVSLPRQEQPIAYDLTGRVEHLSLRQLPATLAVPRLDTNVTAAYHVRGTEPSARTAAGRTFAGDFTFDDSTLPGVHILRGSTASIALNNADLSYGADATVSNLDLEQIGGAFDVPALAVERYRTNLNGHLVATGRGTESTDLNLTANGTLESSTWLGGDIEQLTFDASLADDTLRVRAAGAFSNLDPAVVGGKPSMSGSVNGSLDVDATVSNVSAGVSPDTVAATGRVMVERSTVGDVVIDRASVDADYRESQADIRSLEVTGRDVNLKADGTLALNDTGQSNLTVHADTPSLEQVGKLFDVEVTGIVRVDATITGNRTELQAKGTAVGSGLNYGSNGALTVSSDFTARVDHLEFERAEVEADTHATFVAIAGQSINEVTATTTYADKRVVFDGAAKQRERSVGLAGELILHPEHQEVHLKRLLFDTRGTQWQLQPGADAAITYGNESVSLEHVKLVSGDQEIDADGTFGRPGDALRVTLTNVSLETVDAMLLRPPQFSGRLNADASVTGTMSAPSVSGQFAVNQGGFKEFRYDSLNGTVSYAGKGLTLDSRLQQNPTQWITAKGYLPMTLFAGADETVKADHTGHTAAADPDERIDLVIDSSPIDLGIVQGFTTALTKVGGTVEAHIRVTGSGADPHPTGTVAIDNGSVDVTPAGTRYQNITGRINLEPDRVHIDQIRLVDNHQSELIVSGDLAVHELDVGTVQIDVKADDFKVIDNKMGNVRVRSDIQLTGELSAPRIEGTLAVTTASVNLDEILAMTGTSAYATSPTTFTTPTESAGEEPPPRTFDNLTMNVQLKVPNDLVVKASSLQTPGAPIGLGSLTVTIGGDLSITKAQLDPIRIVGVVNTVRGNYDFQGRRFEILRDGTVRFDGLEEIDPTLDLRTRRIIQGVEARVNIRGQLSAPELQLTSTPPLDEADILSLIVFNQPINELGTGQQMSLAARAQGLATGVVTSQIASSIGGALALDTFEINVAPENSQSAEITVGQQVGQNLYVKVQQGIGEVRTTNLILEYELTEWLRLRTNIVQGDSTTERTVFRRVESTGADLLFFFSY